MKKKLNLKEIEVKSFVTCMDDEKQAKLKGGVPETHGCPVVTFKIECLSKTLVCP